MPLENNLKNQGKGGFKLIQYLSIGLPVIGSRVGINEEIIDCTNGYLTEGLKDQTWATAIMETTSDIITWETMSKCSLNKWEQTYSFKKNLEIWRKLIK